MPDALEIVLRNVWNNIVRRAEDHCLDQFEPIGRALMREEPNPGEILQKIGSFNRISDREDAFLSFVRQVRGAVEREEKGAKGL